MTLKPRFVGLLAWLWASFCVGSLVANKPLPSLHSKQLAQGPYSSMRMLLEKTILKIDVATVDVRVGKKAQTRFAQLARGKGYSRALGQQLASVATSAEQALVQMRFERDVSLDRWMGVVRENLQQARDAGLISAKLQQRVSQGLPKWFAALRERGYKKGDRLLYRVRPGSLRTAVAAANGQVLVDMQDKEKDAPRVVLASYFAPGSDFREPLLRSLLK